MYKTNIWRKLQVSADIVYELKQNKEIIVWEFVNLRVNIQYLTSKILKKLICHSGKHFFFC